MGFSYQIHSAISTDTGRKRTHNEDFVAFFEPVDQEEIQASGCLYIVADGVGGAAKGERASRYATQKVLYEYYRNPQLKLAERLALAMKKAGNEINQYAQEAEPFGRMATTMVAAAIKNQVLTVANVGDSRAYIFRDGAIRQITQDHSYIGEMVRSGELSEDEAALAKGKNRITRSLGGEPDVKVDIFDDIRLQPGDKILLCSDGLTRYASKSDLAKILGSDDPEKNVHDFIAFANQSGGADNISAIVISINPDEAITDLGDQQIARGQTPEPVDWDTFETLPAVTYRPKLSLLNRIKREYLLVGLLSFTSLMLVGMCIWIGSLIINSPNNNKMIPQLTLTSDVDISIPIATSNQTIDATVIPTKHSTLDVVPSTTSDIVDPGEQTNVSVERTTCDYRTIDEDTISGIILLLDADVDMNEIHCSPFEANCGYDSNNSDLVPVGALLRVPNANLKNCIEHGNPVTENSSPDQ